MDTQTDPRWSAIPSVDETSGRRRQVAQPPAGYTRRRFLQGISAVGGALALTALGGLPTLRSRAALAAPGAGPLGAPGAEAAGGALCAGAISAAAYCGPDKWFRAATADGVAYFPTEAMGTTRGLRLRNAWRRTFAGTEYRCAEGYVALGQQGVFRVCAAASP